MKIIGILFGMEKTFPPAIVEYINNAKKAKKEGIHAEFVKIGSTKIAQRMKYDVILDRIRESPFDATSLGNVTLIRL